VDIWFVQKKTVQGYKMFFVLVSDGTLLDNAFTQLLYMVKVLMLWYFVFSRISRISRISGFQMLFGVDMNACAHFIIR